MVKERRFAVHPTVLSCLLHLRLHSELGVRASERHADKENADSKGKGKQSAHKGAVKRAKGKSAEGPHLSKKAKKVLKERKEIEEEMHEAAAEVDKDEKAVAVSRTPLVTEY
jgi:nucleolar complex protein 3